MGQGHDNRVLPGLLHFQVLKLGVGDLVLELSARAADWRRAAAGREKKSSRGLNGTIEVDLGPDEWLAVGVEHAAAHGEKSFWVVRNSRLRRPGCRCLGRRADVWVDRLARRVRPCAGPAGTRCGATRPAATSTAAMVARLRICPDEQTLDQRLGQPGRGRRDGTSDSGLDLWPDGRRTGSGHRSSQGGPRPMPPAPSPRTARRW